MITMACSDKRHAAAPELAASASCHAMLLAEAETAQNLAELAELGTGVMQEDSSISILFRHAQW